MAATSKVIDEFFVGKYKVLKMGFIPTYPHRSININGKKYELVPLYDLPNCIAIESSDTFMGQEVIFE